MKKAFSAVLLILLLLLLTISSSAGGSVNITVTVPSEHTVTVECGTGGRITVSGTEYSGTNAFTAARFGSFTVTAVPSDGYVTDAITCDSGRLTLSENNAVLDRVLADVQINVTFKTASSTTENVSIPVTGKEKTISAKAVVNGDTAKVSVDENELEQLLSADTGAENVTVDISQTEADVNTVIIPISIIEAVALHTDDEENGTIGLEVLFPESAVIFDAAALNAISAQATEDDVTLRIEKIDRSKLTDTQQAAVDADPSDNIIVLSIALSSGDTVISDFNGGSAEIKLPYTPAPGEDISTISVWYVSAGGSMEQVQCSYKDGFVTFTALHFSNYIVKSGIISGGINPHCFICRWCGGNIAPWCIIIPVLFVLLAAGIVIIIFIFIKKRKNKNFYSEWRIVK